MCTLIVGRDVVAPHTLVMAANRDEDPDRPSAPPGVLVEEPRVVGGRDLVAGGTWLAIRERRAAVAMLNRRNGAPAAGRRSRGLLAIDVASTPDRADLAAAARERALEAVREEAYAPFSLLFASAASCWVLAGIPVAPRVDEIEPGWHVITHSDLDDPLEPRTAWLRAGLAGWAPRSAEEAERGLMDRLREHGGQGHPAVCIHGGRMVTVSAATLWLAAGAARYGHAEGRPCETPITDSSSLLAGDAGGPEES